VVQEFNITGPNKGQITKGYTVECGIIDMTQLDQREPNTQIRTRKLWMPCGKVSVPTHQTIEQVKEEWKQMVKDGQLSLGESCYLQTLVKYHRGW